MSELKYWRNNGFILCPYCDYKIKETWDYDFPVKDGYDTYIDCPECENEMALTINVEIQYSTTKKDEQLEQE